MQCARKFECFSFDVACMQCGHPIHINRSHLLASPCASCPASCVDWALRSLCELRVRPQSLVLCKGRSHLFLVQYEFHRCGSFTGDISVVGWSVTGQGSLCIQNGTFTLLDRSDNEVITNQQHATAELVKLSWIQDCGLCVS